MGGPDNRKIRIFSSLIAVLLAMLAIGIMDEKQGGFIFLGFVLMGIILDIVWRGIRAKRNPDLND